MRCCLLHLVANNICDMFGKNIEVPFEVNATNVWQNQKITVAVKKHFLQLFILWTFFHNISIFKYKIYIRNAKI